MNKIKIATNNGQEYAHNYKQEKPYEYLNENDRVTNTVKKNEEENYQIMEIEKPYIKVVKTNSEILEDHRQRAYKIELTPPIKACSNNLESYKIDNDCKFDESLNTELCNTKFKAQIDMELNKDMTNPIERYDTTQKIEFNFKVGNKIKHKEENITGKINFIGKDKLSVIWDDNARERFSILEANCQLENIIEESVNNEKLINNEKITNEKMDENKKLNNLNNKLDDVLNVLDEDENDDGIIIENGIPNNIEIEEIKNERKLTMEQIANVKEKATKELIELMKSNKIITDEETEKIQYETIMKMDDNGFEVFKNAMLSISSNKRKDINICDSEAEKMLKKIKGGGAIIGDFSNVNNNNAGDIGDNNSRNLSSIKANKSSVIQASKNPDMDLSGFKDLHGLTKPIQVTNNQLTSRGSLIDAIKSLDWSMV